MAKAKPVAEVKRAPRAKAPKKMASEDSKFSAASAEKLVTTGGCKIEGRTITVPSKGIGLTRLAALDYLAKHHGARVIFENATPFSHVFPHPDCRGKIISAK